MHHVENKFVMIARRETQVVVILRSQGAQRSKRTNLLQPAIKIKKVAQGLRAVCGVRLLAKGATICFKTCLASYPANLMCVVMRIYSVFPEDETA